MACRPCAKPAAWPTQPSSSGSEPHNRQTEEGLMKIDSNMVALVTGGASGLARATAEKLISQGSKVVIADLPTSDGVNVAKEIGAVFVPADVTSEADMIAAFDEADKLGKLRAVVHCAGRGGP